MKIYCSGIGGIGLSAYASLQKLHGHDVSGSDRSDSALLDDLRSQGIAIFLDQSGVNVPADTDLLVYSEAIPKDAPERRRASDLGCEQQSYPQALGELSAGYQVIAVCGTHGKSSTTAMATRLLLACGKDPTVVVGTKVKELDGRNWRQGKSRIFLLEACEYRHSFLHYSPHIILLTNADGDHFDFYPSYEAYQDAFVQFASKLPADGILVTHLSDPDCKNIADRSQRNVVDADTFPLIQLQTPGEHMRRNAQLILALADVLGISPADAEESVSGYGGSWRRMEVKGTFRSTITVIDDYAHHPREIRATLNALREAYPGRRLVCVFQPHTHDRTIKLYDDFLTAFTEADLVIIPGVYDARREKDSQTVDLPRFIKDIAKGSRTDVTNGSSLTETEAMLRSDILKDGDLLVCMGAGDITALAERMAKN